MADLFNENCPCCGQALPQGAGDATFAAFWDKVHHKVNKAGAQKAWKRLTSAERQLATERWPAFWAAWSKANPQASPIHPATYLNNRRWEDEGTPAAQRVSDGDILQRHAKSIVSGKRYLCTHITPTTARACIAAGLVTEDQCKEVGVL